MNLLLLTGRETLSLRGRHPATLPGLSAAEPVYFYAESYSILYTNATFAGVLFLKEPLTPSTLAGSLLIIAGIHLVAKAGPGGPVSSARTPVSHMVTGTFAHFCHFCLFTGKASEKKHFDFGCFDVDSTPSGMINSKHQFKHRQRR
ncbi:hypothetical protein [Dysosmobacter sp.]